MSLKLETPKEDLEIFDEKEEDQPLVLTKEIKEKKVLQKIKR